MYVILYPEINPTLSSSILRWTWSKPNLGMGVGGKEGRLWRWKLIFGVREKNLIKGVIKGNLKEQFTIL